MIKYGFSTDRSGNAVCAVRQWQEQDCSAGYLLFSYGTLPNPTSVCTDSHSQSLAMAEAQLQTSLALLSTSDGRSDQAYVAANISDVMQKLNRCIYEAAVYLGQGIYIGGVIFFVTQNRFLVVPFGGGEVYLWLQDAKLKYIGDPNPNSYVTTNPLGGCARWTGKYWTGVLKEGSRLLLTSCPLTESPQTIQTLKENSKPDSHDNTAAFLLRQQLEKQDLQPVGVLDLHL